MRSRGNLIIHSAIRALPRFRWAPKHQLAYIYCTTEPESVKGARTSLADLRALVNTANTNAQNSGWPALIRQPSAGPEHVQFESRMGFEDAAMPGNWISIRIMLVSK